jgi:hypothetical protein
MPYIFEIKVNTDGDFCLPFVPRGMKYDENKEYTFTRVYKDKEKTIKDVGDICNFLKYIIDTSKNYVKKSWTDFINRFGTDVEQCTDGLLDWGVYSHMGGNYEETVFSFRKQPMRFKCTFDLTDEESKKIANYKGLVTELKIKNAILELFDEE